MVGKVDVIYAPTDNTIAAGMATVAMVATDNMIPIICGEAGMVEAGGLATYGIDYYKLGYAAGEMAVKVLKGEVKIEETAIGYLDASQCELTLNEEVAATLGIDLTVIDK
jgi:putative ABC transport system substrate-binding protein